MNLALGREKSRCSAVSIAVEKAAEIPVGVVGLGLMGNGIMAFRPDECSYVVKKMERGTGIEPATSSLGSWHSTAELPPLLSSY